MPAPAADMMWTRKCISPAVDQLAGGANERTLRLATRSVEDKTSSANGPPSELTSHLWIARSEVAKLKGAGERLPCSEFLCLGWVARRQERK